MAPPPVTEDYYFILGVSQSATPEEITRSYRRLTLQRHPDRNKKPDATATFQLLVRAYETLNHAEQRRDYDRVYPTVKKPKPHEATPSTSQEQKSSCKTTAPEEPKKSRPSTSTAEAEAARDAEEIARIQKTKQERATFWSNKKRIIDGSIFALERQIRILEREIKAGSTKEKRRSGRRRNGPKHVKGKSGKKQREEEKKQREAEKRRQEESERQQERERERKSTSGRKN